MLRAKSRAKPSLRLEDCTVSDFLAEIVDVNAVLRETVITVNLRLTRLDYVVRIYESANQSRQRGELTHDPVTHLNCDP